MLKDGSGKILYIGKAKVLRDRVRSYFQKNLPSNPRLYSLVRRTRDLEWIVTSSEVEALLAEANLVKKHAPKYNVSLKDDKSFPYIRITREPYPQVLLTRRIVKDGSNYFGPYTEVKTLRKTLKVIHKVFPIRSCDYYINKESIEQNKHSVCLDYHIKKCRGPCEGLVSREAYNGMVHNVVRFLHGRTDSIIKDLKATMEAASEARKYEEAARFRDQLRAVETFSNRQRKVSATFDDKDIIALSVRDKDACAAVIRLRNGKVMSREKVYLLGVEEDNLRQAVHDFIRQFYMDADFVPREIIVRELPRDVDAITEWLERKRNKRVYLTVPRRGEKVRLLRMGEQNADLLLEEYRRRRKRRKELVPGMVQRLQSDLRLSVPPRRIEAFDISALHGTNPVGSMVSFVDGASEKREYRKYKIKSVRGIDDFAMIREVVFRRYTRLKSENATMPDLILVDGGKGQLGMAVSALQVLGLTYIPVVGLAKRLEEIYLPGYSEPQSIPKSSPGLTLLRRIRDEAHRFAVTFHRQQRKETVTRSIFEEIRGVGPVTRKRLLGSFDNVEAIAEASTTEVCEKASVGVRIADEIISMAKSTTTSS